MTRYQAYIQRKQLEFGIEFDPSDLDPRFIEPFNRQNRIIAYIYGQRVRGIVGVSTGWKPVFLLMLTRQSRGSSYVLDQDAKLVA